MDSGQVCNEFLSCGFKVFTVETEWKLPSLNLVASIGIIFAWLEPFSWVGKLDISKE
jgi:hypothetical protein